MCYGMLGSITASDRWCHSYALLTAQSSSADGASLAVVETWRDVSAWSTYFFKEIMEGTASCDIVFYIYNTDRKR